MKQIYIFSAGPGGRDVLRLIEDINDVSPTWEVMGFVENEVELIGTVIDDLNVFSLNEVPKSSDFYGICGVQDPYLRRRIVYNEISPKGYNLAALVHPNIVKAKDFTRREGTVIFSSVNISYNVNVGKCVLVSFNTLIGHDGEIGDFSSILSTAVINGECRVGKNSIIGSASVIHPNVHIGDDCVVGMGTSLFNDIVDGKSVVDLPKKLIRDRVNKEYSK